MTFWVVFGVVVYSAGVLFILAICRAAALADRAMEDRDRD